MIIAIYLYHFTANGYLIEIISHKEDAHSNSFDRKSATKGKASDSLSASLAVIIIFDNHIVKDRKCQNQYFICMIA